MLFANNLKKAKKYIPFAKPDIDENDIEEVVEAIKSGWLSKGPKVIEFEKQFRDKIAPKRDVIACNSGTSALHLAMLGLNIGDGDEVIVPSLTFCSTVNVIEHVGAKPVFVDIVEENLCLDIDQAISKVNDKTKAIIMVHFGGRTNRLDELKNFCEEKQIYLIEDAAHAVGSKYNDEYIGNHGDIICYSFYATKNITTGEGGALVVKNPMISEKIRLLSWHGITKSAWNRYDKKGTWKYEVVLPGYKYNMTDIQAALGINQLNKMELMKNKREQIAKRYYERLIIHDEIMILPEREISNQLHSWHLYPVRIKKNSMISRNDMIELLKERMIGTSVHFIPVHMHPYYKNKYNECLPVTEKVYKGIMSLPIYSQLQLDDVDLICDNIDEIIKNYRGNF